MIKPRLFRGFRDYPPEEMLPREKLIEHIKHIFHRYGFVPLETPAIEYVDVLLGKYGSEGEKLIYRLAYKDGNTLALRYDLTVPLARFYAMNYTHLPLPFRRYQIEKVWRAEHAQMTRGRFREFYQCDVDIVGAFPPLPDAELISLINDALSDIGFHRFIIKTSHRKFLPEFLRYAGIERPSELEVARVVDKLDRLGKEDVVIELEKLGLSARQIDKLFDILDISGEPDEVIDRLSSLLGERISGICGEMKRFFDMVSSFGVPKEKLVFDLSLMRGLDYYTGIVFEAYLPDFPDIGSLAGGGRYDNLVGLFMNRSVPATGTTIGVDRILTAMRRSEIVLKDEDVAKVFFALFDKGSVDYVLSIVSHLRREGIPVELAGKLCSLKENIQTAAKKNYRYLLIAGGDEKSKAVVAVRDLKTREQKEFTVSELVKWGKGLC
ncbi:MAG: histidine--tRNA ligase [candidate division Zixibacteria bacterium 4484_93]|nr:MAG: histidine--tRNA ligase [candidate division Zixibacteria bacterium 4484_93]